MTETEGVRSGTGQTRDQMRAADGDRAVVAERLRNALDEGRLTLAEYDERVRVAYASVTYADLNKLLSDLPTSGGVLELRPPSHAPAAPPQPVRAPGPPRPRPAPRRIPTALMVLWTVWGGIVAVNMAVWLILTVTVGGIYPWPIWVAGPSGAALLAVTIGVQAIRETRHDPREH